jgi:hypothetical protein
MRIKSESSYWAATTTFAGLFTLSFIGFYVFVMVQGGKGSWFLYVFVTPFFLVGFALAAWGVRGLLRRVLFSQWYVEFERPGVLGQAMNMRLFSGQDVTPVGDIECNLCCLRNDSIATPNNRVSKITTLWETTWQVRVALIPAKLGTTLSLPLPENSALSSNGHGGFGSSLEWQLTVNIPLQGLSDAPIFKIPVSRR